MELLSIIIPAYNNYAFVQRCLHSLEGQSCRNFEVILVDDGSSNDTHDNLIRYVRESRMRICLIRNEKNCGPGPSRNRAVRQARGRYLTFLDSDDYLDRDAVRDLSDAIERTGADAVLFDFSCHRNGLITRSRVYLSDCGDYVPTSDAIVYTRGSSWGKAYRRDRILDHQVEFAQTRNAEDIPFTKTVLSYCEKIYYLKKNLYYYVQHKDSLIHDASLLDIRNTETAMRCLEKMISDRFPREFAAIIAEYLFYDVCLMLRTKIPAAEIIRHIESVEHRYPGCYEAARQYCHWTLPMKRWEQKLLQCVKGRHFRVLRFYVMLKQSAKDVLR